MALPSQYVKIEVRWTTALNARQEVVLWFQPDATIAMADGVDESQVLALLADTTFNLAIKAVLSTDDAAYGGCHAHLNLDGVTFIAGSTTFSGAGSEESPTQAENVAVVLRKRTDHGGKTGRGRWFMGAVPESLTDAGRCTDAGLALYQALGDLFAGILITARANYGPRHLSRKDAAMYPIRACNAQRYTRSQRRRLVRLFA